jgi:hypothetical protein
MNRNSGKGDKARNNWGNKFRENYDNINWCKKQNNMKIFDDELYLYAKKANISFCELVKLVNDAAQKTGVEDATAFEVKKKLDEKIKYRLERKKLP